VLSFIEAANETCYTWRAISNRDNINKPINAGGLHRVFVASEEKIGYKHRQQITDVVQLNA
jgi:hypothetical protein